MTVIEIAKKLNCQIICGQKNANKEISGAYCSDMLSDVMGKAKEGQVWITMQTHKNTIAVAMLKDLAAILLVNDGKPNQDTIEAAEEEGLTILSSSEPTFELAGKLFQIVKNESL